MQYNIFYFVDFMPCVLIPQIKATITLILFAFSLFSIVTSEFSPVFPLCKISNSPFSFKLTLSKNKTF